MDSYNNDRSDLNSIKKNNSKKRFHLPFVAFFINLIPILLMLLMSLHLLGDNQLVNYFTFAMSIVWMATGFGVLFHIVGVTFAVYYLCSKTKQKTSTGIALSIVSIIFPFVLWFVFISFGIMNIQMLP